ncbi:MAG: hypothetical protein QXL78_02795 [Methanocellales archaeon]
MLGLKMAKYRKRELQRKGTKKMRALEEKLIAENLLDLKNPRGVEI